MNPSISNRNLRFKYTIISHFLLNETSTSNSETSSRRIWFGTIFKPFDFFYTTQVSSVKVFASNDKRSACKSLGFYILKAHRKACFCITSRSPRSSALHPVRNMSQYIIHGWDQCPLFAGKDLVNWQKSKLCQDKYKLN